MSRPDPVFVGGVRSGTTVAGMLISAHPLYAEVPELQFHSHHGGLADLLVGRTTVAQFVERMEGWYLRSPPAPRPPGIHELIPRRRFHAHLKAFESSFARAPWEASRALILALVEARLRETGRVTWVETTPSTTAAASTLHRLLPEARFIHLLRDGRDSVASLRRRGWGPEDVAEALRWWAQRMWLADRELRMIPRDRVCVIRLEDLVLHDREGCYRRLLEFLEAGDEPAMRSFFEQRISAKRAHVGGWREDLGVADVQRLDAIYGEVVERLARDGVCLGEEPSRA